MTLVPVERSTAWSVFSAVIFHLSVSSAEEHYHYKSPKAFSQEGKLSFYPPLQTQALFCYEKTDVFQQSLKCLK